MATAGAVLDDLAAITDLGLPVKVILEVGRLDPAALALLVEISIDAGARFLKTGSGFGPPVTAEQVTQLVSLARGRAAVKAAGGIADLEQALALVEAGAGRLGHQPGGGPDAGPARRCLSANLEGLALSCRPLGENDRLLTLLSEDEGLTRLAVPGARGARRAAWRRRCPWPTCACRWAGAAGCGRVRQLRVLRNYSGLAQRLETLAAAQALGELCLKLVPGDAPAPGMLADLLLQLGRLEEVVRERAERAEALAMAVQGSVHLLALGGYALPLQHCARSGAAAAAARSATGTGAAACCPVRAW